MGSRALQDMNGVTSMVLYRSLGFSNTREAMMAGTLHPNPSTMGKNARPDSPNFPMIPSIT